MTAKRFVLFQDSYDELYIQDKDSFQGIGVNIRIGNENDINYLNMLKVVKVLNELYNENESLKRRLMIMEDKVKGLMK